MFRLCTFAIAAVVFAQLVAAATAHESICRYDGCFPFGPPYYAKRLHDFRPRPWDGMPMIDSFHTDPNRLPWPRLRLVLAPRANTIRRVPGHRPGLLAVLKSDCLAVFFGVPRSFRVSGGLGARYGTGVRNIVLDR